MRLHELLVRLDSIRLRLVSILWYRWRFGKCGARFAIGAHPRLINPHLMFLGDRVNIGPFSRLEVHHGATNAAELRIGSDAMIQHGVHIYATGTLTIGDNALFASGVMITDNNHGFSPSDGPFALQPLMHRRTTIGANVWLGENVAVLSGVTIGNDVIVGANAVVAHDLPARCIALGNPARPVKRYDIATRKWVLFSVDGE